MLFLIITFGFVATKITVTRFVNIGSFHSKITYYVLIAINIDCSCIQNLPVAAVPNQEVALDNHITKLR